MREGRAARPGRQRPVRVPPDGASRGEPRPLSRVGARPELGWAAEDKGGSAPALRSAAALPVPPVMAGKEGAGAHTKVIAGGDPRRY